MSESQPENSRSRKRMFLLLAFCIVLVLLSANIAYTSYYVSSRELRDPTYQEALQFIESDRTDKNQYNVRKYTCADFAADFQNNAFKAGYRCGFVLLFFTDRSHASNSFNTTDYGLIFIEPQVDEIVKLEIGQQYWDRTKYAPRDYDDTISGFLIFWEREEAQRFTHRVSSS